MTRTRVPVNGIDRGPDHVATQRAFRQVELSLNEFRSELDELAESLDSFEAGSGVTSVDAGSNAVSVAPTTGAVVVDVVPANFTGIPQSGITSLVSDLAGKAAASHTHAESDVTGLVADLAAKVPTSRTISTTSPLSGGGDLSANRTLTVADNSTSSKGVVAQAPNDTTQFWRGDAAWAVPPGLAVALIFLCDGIDGDLNFDGAATVTLPDGNSIVPSGGVYTLPRDLMPNNITVGGSATLKTDGFGVFAKGTSTIDGLVSVNGGNGGTPTGGTAGYTGTRRLGTPTAGGGGGNPGTGTGGTASGSTMLGRTTQSTGVNGGSGGTPPSAGNAPHRGGGAGQSGAGNSGGSGGTVTPAAAGTGAATLFDLLRGRNPGGTIWSYGAGGGGGGSSGAGTVGGGGGGGGGAGLWITDTLTGTGTMSADGGNGGNGSGASAGGGGGGGGGAWMVLYRARSGSVTIRANGGNGGNGAGTGSNGAAGANGLVITS